MTAKKKSTGMTVHKGGSHAPVKHKRRAKGLRRRARGAGLLKGGSQGMAPTLKRFGIVGAAAVGTHVLATALTDRLFIDPANTANPSYTGTADKVDSRENMRAGVAILGGLAAGYMLRKRGRDLVGRRAARHALPVAGQGLQLVRAFDGAADHCDDAERGGASDGRRRAAAGGRAGAGPARASVDRRAADGVTAAGAR